MKITQFKDVELEFSISSPYHKYNIILHQDSYLVIWVTVVFIKFILKNITSIKYSYYKSKSLKEH